MFGIFGWHWRFMQSHDKKHPWWLPQCYGKPWHRSPTFMVIGDQLNVCNKKLGSEAILGAVSLIYAAVFCTIPWLSPPSIWLVSPLGGRIVFASTVASPCLWWSSPRWKLSQWKIPAESPHRHQLLLVEKPVYVFILDGWKLFLRHFACMLSYSNCNIYATFTLCSCCVIWKLLYRISGTFSSHDGGGTYSSCVWGLTQGTALPQGLPSRKTFWQQIPKYLRFQKYINLDNRITACKDLL